MFKNAGPADLNSAQITICREFQGPESKMRELKLETTLTSLLPV